MLFGWSSLTAWRTEPALALTTAAAGSLVILESWFTALGFLHRAAPLRLKARWIDLSGRAGALALRPGRGRELMLSLFWVFDSRRLNDGHPAEVKLAGS